MAHKFNVGDVVRLKSDSRKTPVMVIRAYTDSSIAYQSQARGENIPIANGVICDWNSTNGKPYEKLFNEDDLELA